MTLLDIQISKHMEDELQIDSTHKPFEAVFMEQPSGNDQKSLVQQQKAIQFFDLDIDQNSESKWELSKKRRREILNEAQEMKRQIQPLEFESYEDYYLISHFKKGISVSGKVDTDALKTRKTSIYYKRIKRNNNVDSQDGEADQSSQSEDDEHIDKSYCPNKRTTRAQKSKLKNDSPGPDLVNDSLTSDTRPPSNRIVGDISVECIIPVDSSDNNVRRSSRLSQRERDFLERGGKRLESHEFLEEGTEEMPEIVNLYELIVPKVLDPARRSDWILPSKDRFVPEKITPIKHKPEQVKINDLIHNDRIRKVLTRFKGGLAGIKKKDWAPVKASEEK